MRLLLVLMLAFVVLPFSGCAKKKKADTADATASTNESSDANYEDPAEEGHAEDSADDEAVATDMPDDMFDDPATDDMYADAEEPQTFDEGDSGEGEEFVEGRAANLPAADGQEDPSAKSKIGTFFQSVLDFAGGQGGSKSADSASTEGVDDGELPDEAETEAFTDDPDTTDNDGAGDIDNGGQGTQNPQKPTDVRGVKEGTAEYAVVSLILNVTKGKTEGLDSLIAEDVSGLLEKLRSGPDETALAEAKELMGKVKLQNSRLENRDTVIYFLNDNEKILQFYVRRIQGEYVIRELRIRDAVNRTPTRQPTRRRR